MIERYERAVQKTVMAAAVSCLAILAGVIGLVIAGIEFVTPSTPDRGDELLISVIGVVLVGAGVIGIRIATPLNRRYQEAASKEYERVEEAKFRETKQMYAEASERNMRQLANLNSWKKNTVVQSFRAEPGGGQDAGCSVIAVEWETDPQHRARLWLYKHRGDLLTSAEAVLNAPGARRLDSRVLGETLRYVDPDVSPSVVDNYYIWIDATVAEQAVSGAGFYHIAHRHAKKEDFVSFVDRKVSQHEAAERLAKIKKPQKAEALEDVAARLLDEAIGQREETRKIGEWLERKLEDMSLSDEERQIIFTRVMSGVESARAKQRGGAST